MNATEWQKLWLRFSARYIQYHIFINVTFKYIHNEAEENSPTYDENHHPWSTILLVFEG